MLASSIVAGLSVNVAAAAYVFNPLQHLAGIRYANDLHSRQSLI